MPRKNSPSPTPSSNTSSLERARTAITKFLPRVSTASFDLGMASAMACAIGALASPAGGLDNQALLALMSSLGVNWLASAVQRWRDQAHDLSSPDRAYSAIQSLAQDLLPHMTDQRLHEVVTQLDLVQATLAGLKGNQPALDAVARDALARGFVKQDDLHRITQSIQVSIAGDVTGSMLNIAGGDITLSHVTINNNGRSSWEDLSEDIAEHKSVLAQTLSRMDLTGFEVNDTQKRSLRLESMYTPLYAETTARAASATILSQLSDAPRAVILGGPGSGKSTVLNYVGLLLCGRATEYKAEWQHGLRLPLQVTLRWFARHVRAKQAEVDPADPERHRKQADRDQFARGLESTPEKALLNFVREGLKSRSDQPLHALTKRLELFLEQNGAVWLLDGLDEVPATQREMIRRAIENLTLAYPRCRFIVACRPYSYRHIEPTQAHALKIAPAGMPFAELDVLPLRPPQIEIFIDKWYRLLIGSGVLPREYLVRAGELYARVAGNPRLLRLASQPLLLRLMANLHSSGKPLPEDRWELLKNVVELLLLNWQERLKDAMDPGKERLAYELLRGKRDEVLAKLRRLAYELQRDPNTKLDDEQASDIPRSRLLAMLGELLTPECGVNAEDLESYLRDRSGIVLHEGAPGETDHRYRFPHRMFQEYLAAEHLQGNYDDDEVGFVSLLDADFDRWREVYALIALMNDLRRTADCVRFICPESRLPTTSKDCVRAFLAIDIWTDKHPTPDELRSNRPTRESVRSVYDYLLGALAASSSGLGVITPELRAEVGRKLVLLPNLDPVRFTCADQRHATCANLRTPEGLAEYAHNGFVHIAAKGQTFTMQAGYENAGAATLDHDYLIGKTPVTYAQFEPFVEDGQGYGNDAHWTQAGLAWRGERTQPRDWQDPKWHIPNHPVVNVTWHEAHAYCRWLTQKVRGARSEEREQIFLELGSEIEAGLPSELEWEYAARRDTERQYPWKKALKDTWVKGDEARCNVSETGLERTTAVGIFADGATPDGIHDLKGNVWEWLGTTWDSDWRKVKDTPEGDARRGLRGGSWAYLHEGVLGYRGRSDPDLVNVSYGFRVVVRAHFSFSNL